MSDSDSADLEYKQLMESRQSQRFVSENAEALSGAPVRLETTVPPKQPNPDMNPGNTRTEEELKAMGLSYDQIPRPAIPTPAQEALQTPGGNAVSEALAPVGEAGKKAMEAASPLLDVAGKAVGLELPRGGMAQAVSEVAGLPTPADESATAGIKSLLAGTPFLLPAKALKGADLIKRSEEQANSLYKTGVGAVSISKGLVNGTPVYSVPILPQFNASVPGHATPKDIQRFYDSVANEIDLTGEMASVTAVFNKDTGETNLGIHLMFDTLDDATAFARAAKQPTVHSMGSGYDIATGAKSDQSMWQKPFKYRPSATQEPGVLGMRNQEGDYIPSEPLSPPKRTSATQEPGVLGTRGQEGDSIPLGETLPSPRKGSATQEPGVLGRRGQEGDFMMGESGKTHFQAAMTLATAMAGGAFGYAVGADDQKVADALVGAGLGALAPMAIPLAKAMIRGKLSSTTGGLGAAALTKAEQATPLSDIAKAYRARVEEMRRGTRPHAKAREEGAQKLAAGDLSDEYLMTRNPGATYNDETIAAMKEVLTQEGQKLQQLAGAYMLNPSNKQTEEAFLKQFATYAHIDPLDVGLEAEAGRSLSYLNDVENEINRFTRNMSGVVGKVRATQSPLRMAQMVAATPSLSQLNDFTRRATAPGLTDMIAESWINGLLSQPITHVTNSMSNLITILTSVPERAIAQGFGTLTGGPGGVVAGETTALARGYLNSVQGAWLTAAKAFRTDTPQFGSQKMEVRNQAISQHNFDMMLERAGVDPLIGSWTKMFDYIGTAARVPGRLLLAEDEFFKAIVFGGESSAQAWRHAALEVGSSGAKGKVLKDGINNRYNAIMADPTQLSAFAHDAEEFAAYLTFTKDLGEVGQTMQKLSQHPLGRFIAPFMRTPINLAKYAGERTPFALLSAAVRDDIAKGGATRDLALAKLAAGSSAMITFATLSATGVITGFGPADKETRAIWQTDGRKPYSVNVTGLTRLATGRDPAPVTGDQWVTYSRIDPIGMLIGLSADVTDIMQNSDDPEVHDHLAARLTLVASHVFASKTYVKGVAEWMFAAADPEHYGGKLEESLARTLVTAVPVVGPGAKLVQRATDPLVRETNGVIDAIKSTLPGLSNQMPPKRNYWGEVTLKEGWQALGLNVENVFSPFYRSTALKDDVVKRLVENRVNLTPPRDTIGKVKLNPQQYDYLREQFGEVKGAGGRNVHQMYEYLLDKFPDNTTDPQSQLHLLLKNQEDVYKGLAREALYRKYPDLRDATGRVTAQEKARSMSIPPPKRGVSEITVE